MKLRRKEFLFKKIIVKDETWAGAFLGTCEHPKIDDWVESIERFVNEIGRENLVSITDSPIADYYGVANSRTSDRLAVVWYWEG